VLAHSSLHVTLEQVLATLKNRLGLLLCDADKHLSFLPSLLHHQQASLAGEIGRGRSASTQFVSHITPPHPHASSQPTRITFLHRNHPRAPFSPWRLAMAVEIDLTMASPIQSSFYNIS